MGTLILFLVISLSEFNVAATKILYPNVCKDSTMTDYTCPGNYADCLSDADTGTYCGSNQNALRQAIFLFDDMPSIGDSVIEYVKLYIQCRRTSFASNTYWGRASTITEPLGAWRLCGGGAECGCKKCPQAADSTTLTTTFTWYSFTFICDPCDSSSAWTVSKLNSTSYGWGARFAESVLAGYRYLADMYLEVTYSAAAVLVNEGASLVRKTEEGILGGGIVK